MMEFDNDNNIARYNNIFMEILNNMIQTKEIHPIIVLDLDNTLVHTVSKEYFDIIGRPADAVFEESYVYLRPYTAEFLMMLRSKFKRIGIWSFGMKRYVDKIVELLGGDFEFVYAYDCPPPGKNPAIKAKELCFIDKTHNGLAFIVDDLPANCIYNMDRSINIRPFYLGIDDNDCCLIPAYNSLIKKVDELEKKITTILNSA
jgi:hypothetical protein